MSKFIFEGWECIGFEDFEDDVIYKLLDEQGKGLVEITKGKLSYTITTITKRLSKGDSKNENIYTFNIINSKNNEKLELFRIQVSLNPIKLKNTFWVIFNDNPTHHVKCDGLINNNYTQIENSILENLKHYLTQESIIQKIEIFYQDPTKEKFHIDDLIVIDDDYVGNGDMLLITNENIGMVGDAISFEEIEKFSIYDVKYSYLKLKFVGKSMYSGESIYSIKKIHIDTGGDWEITFNGSDEGYLLNYEHSKGRYVIVHKIKTKPRKTRAIENLKYPWE